MLLTISMRIFSWLIVTFLQCLLWVFQGYCLKLECLSCHMLGRLGLFVVPCDSGELGDEFADRGMLCLVFGASISSRLNLRLCCGDWKFLCCTWIIVILSVWLSVVCCGLAAEEGDFTVTSQLASVHVFAMTINLCDEGKWMMSLCLRHTQTHVYLFFKIVSCWISHQIPLCYWLQWHFLASLFIWSKLLYVKCLLCSNFKPNNVGPSSA